MLNKSGTYHGVFDIEGHSLWGELKLAGADTKLTLRTEAELPNFSLPDNIFGQLHDFTLVSCIGCVGGEIPTRHITSQGKSSLSWDIFPHQVISGRQFFNPNIDKVKKVWFTTTDLQKIFDDFDSFGSFRRPSDMLKELLPKKIGTREVPIGDNPMIVYFAGRESILRTSFSYGIFECQHCPGIQLSSEGAKINAEIRIQIIFDESIEVSVSLLRLSSIGQFLSLVAGRSQVIGAIQLESAPQTGEPSLLSVIRSFEKEATEEYFTPHWRDIPLDGVRRPDEFSSVLRSWFSNDDHSLARARLYDCRQLGNLYTIDRLVAAANMFDLEKSPTNLEIDPLLLETKNACLLLMRQLPQSDDRDNAIFSLARIGEMTLRKKILLRAERLASTFHLENLDEIVRQAVLFRNFLVHGSGDKRFNLEIAEQYMSFLTVSLEFIFATSELMRNGWLADDWKHRAFSRCHWFSMYLENFGIERDSLLADLKKAREDRVKPS